MACVAATALLLVCGGSAAAFGASGAAAAAGGDAGDAVRPLVVFHQYPQPGTTVSSAVPVNGREGFTFELAFNQEVSVVPGKVWSVLEDGKVVFEAVTPTYWVRSYTPTVRCNTNLTLRAGSKYVARLEAGAFRASTAGNPSVSPAVESAFAAEAVIGFNATVPSAPAQQATVKPALAAVSRATVERIVRDLASSYYNRFFDSADGLAAAQAIHTQVSAILADVPGATTQLFKMPFRMPAVIASVGDTSPSAQVVVIGAHLDSIDRQNWTVNVRAGRAPGADDDASGVGLLVAFAEVIAAQHTALIKSGVRIELHWYSGEEEGLYGSAWVAAAMAKDKVRVAAMLMIDQAGYVRDPSKPVAAYFTDNTDPDINRLIKACAALYVPELPLVESNEEGRAASDFYSFNKWGWRTGYVAEGPIDSIVYGNNKHTSQDLIGGVDFDHALRVGKITFSTALEVLLSL